MNMLSVLVGLLDAIFLFSTCTACSPPYDPVGEYCFFIDEHMRGTWTYMREVCLAIEGDLVNLKDQNKLFDISNYIKNHGLTNSSFWVGAGDQQQEGEWIWASDGTEVRMGTPLWGHWNHSQPDGGDDEDCAILSKDDFYYMHDDSCDSVHGIICQPSFSTDSASMINKQQHRLEEGYNDCLYPFEVIGDACLWFHPSKFYTWQEAREFCTSNDTRMAKIDDANQLGAVYDYLISKGIKTNLWLDGTDQVVEGDWIWHDVTPVKIGTPFWDVNHMKSQEPTGDTEENCLYIGYVDSYYFRDSNCNNTLGFICQYHELPLLNHTSLP